MNELLGCVQYLKDTIQKQFTTQPYSQHPHQTLCSIPQRYNSKAIHNSLLVLCISLNVVFNTSKIQFKSNSQPATQLEEKARRCVQYLKDTIQKQFTTRPFRRGACFLLCSIPQRYNSKAIHNTKEGRPTKASVVFNTSKIQFKSNSQHGMVVKL